jgi:hypothetical protein
MPPMDVAGAGEVTVATRGRPSFSARSLRMLETARMIKVRSGRTHRFTGVWAVVARGRLFVRSWNDDATGWRLAFVAQPDGALEVLGRRIAVRARPVRAERLLAAVDEAYAAKYATPANRKWVAGLRRARRRATTTELLPRR